MNPVLRAMSTLQDKVAKELVYNGVELLRTYHDTIKSNARLFITVVNEATITKPAVALAESSIHPALTNLNISPGTISPAGITWGDAEFYFECRVAGIAVMVTVPYRAVFNIWSPDNDDLSVTQSSVATAKPGSPFVELVALDVPEELKPEEPKKKPSLSLVVNNKEPRNEKLH